LIARKTCEVTLDPILQKKPCTIEAQTDEEEIKAIIPVQIGMNLTSAAKQRKKK